MNRLFALLLTACVAAPVSALAETAVAAARSGAGFQAVTVSVVQPAASADLILLGSGYRAGLRAGMSCVVTREGAAIAELVLVDLRPHAAAGLITALSADQMIRLGDAVFPKLQSL
jgi:hypothetical protein